MFHWLQMGFTLMILCS